MISLPAVLGLTNSEHQVEMEPTAEQHHRVKKDEFERYKSASLLFLIRSLRMLLIVISREG